MTIRSAALGLLFSSTLLACATGPHLAVDARSASPRACAVPRAPGASETEHAIACAEEFVARNGYTKAPADTDTSRLVRESIEREPSWAGVLARRRETLRPRAVGVCDDLTVVFQYTHEGAANARAVTMSRDFGDLRVHHSDFMLANLTERRLGCRTVP